MINLTNTLIETETETFNQSVINAHSLREEQSLRQMWKKAGRTRLSFTVSDTGMGMSEAFLSHLFEPFEQERVQSHRTGNVWLH